MGWTADDDEHDTDADLARKDFQQASAGIVRARR